MLLSYCTLTVFIFCTALSVNFFIYFYIHSVVLESKGLTKIKFLVCLRKPGQENSDSDCYSFH